jgi:serpin B
MRPLHEELPVTRLPIVLLIAALVGGCGAPAPSAPAASAQPEPAGIELAAAKIPLVSTTADDAAKAGAAVNAFGLDLYGRLAAQEAGKNLVISPASIALALAMARAGAKGQTAAEMDAVLRDLGTDANAAWVAALHLALNARTASFEDETGAKHDVTLRVVNAPFAQRDYALEQPYLEALSSRLDAGLRLVDYKTAAEAARVAINAWVAGQTEDRIKELIATGTLDTDTRLVLVNAMYLKAAWRDPFSEDSPDAPFTLADGTVIQVPTMLGGGSDVPYATGDGWQAVQVPYVGGTLGMLVILPDDLATFEAGLDAAALDAITGALDPSTVYLRLPRFAAQTSTDVGELLTAMGMPTAFTSAADFTGITTEEPLQIGAVIHQANIDVSEKGTEAAAATAVEMVAGSAPAEPVELQVDHPFLFALRDLETGAVLFLGRVADPSAASAGAAG